VVFRATFPMIRTHQDILEFSLVRASSCAEPTG
jgi:hypothetical protein